MLIPGACGGGLLFYFCFGGAGNLCGVFIFIVIIYIHSPVFVKSFRLGQLIRWRPVRKTRIYSTLLYRYN